ncbi:MAG: response regulator transcription factor [Acidobacteriaceae bacterium]|jgi:DNA-binding response OmpR family regulator|nr:response regulator transcription factor [Acidobacteriaceae bacterium]
MWILVIEDEPAMGDILRRGLEEENHTVTLVRDGIEGLRAAETCEIDAIVLDVMLPELSGIELARILRSTGRQMPILMLTARDAAADIVKGLDAGADDYLTKPFAFDVLLARLRALTRRAARPTARVLHASGLVLDPDVRQVRRGDRLLDLTLTEFRLLEFLMRRAGRVCARTAIIDGVWGLEQDVKGNTVDAFIRLLRAKIDEPYGPSAIETVRGFGYILRDEDR